jgi:magnesium-transporting ATPase (P-type)
VQINDIIGMNSVYGQVKALVEKERSNTPLQDKLEELADFIGWLGVGAAVLTFLALLVKVSNLQFSF